MHQKTIYMYFQLIIKYLFLRVFSLFSTNDKLTDIKYFVR